ncbi:MAG TPA: EamA family transporter, partial [Accumulibacter sp.]|nr:EamA family transporter [Accumulibacter sp.]
MSGRRQWSGIGFGLLAYAMWGLFPLFFRQLAHVSPLEILCHRAWWACVFVSLLLSVRQQWGKVFAVLGNLRQMRWLLLASLLIGSNWLMFLWA